MVHRLKSGLARVAVSGESLHTRFKGTANSLANLTTLLTAPLKDDYELGVAITFTLNPDCSHERLRLPRKAALLYGQTAQEGYLLVSTRPHPPLDMVTNGCAAMF